MRRVALVRDRLDDAREASLQPAARRKFRCVFASCAAELGHPARFGTPVDFTRAKSDVQIRGASRDDWRLAGEFSRPCEARLRLGARRS